MDILIRNVTTETARRLSVLAAVAGLDRQEFIRRLLEERGLTAAVAMEMMRQTMNLPNVAEQ